LNRQIPWLRTLVEGVVIVGSILLAFGVQAWWDGRQERTEEDRLLVSVLDDMRANRQEIERKSAYHTAALASERRILSLAGTPLDQVTQAVADSLIGDVAWWKVSQGWRMGGLDALTGGGRIEVISREELRSALLGWHRVLDDVRSMEDQENEFFDNALMPYLRNEAWVPQIAEEAQIQPGTDFRPGYGEMNWASEPRDHRPLLLAPAFQNLVVQKLWIQTDILRAYQDFSAEVDSLIHTLEAELGR
jgi:hypothetical protein